MSDRTGIILGFDPGGRENFGWSICHAGPDDLTLLRSGLSSDAQGAFATVTTAIRSLGVPGNPQVLAAGIDAPMFWSAAGDREADRALRSALPFGKRIWSCTSTACGAPAWYKGYCWARPSKRDTGVGVFALRSHTPQPCSRCSRLRAGHRSLRTSRYYWKASKTMSPTRRTLPSALMPGGRCSKGPPAGRTYIAWNPGQCSP